MEAKRFPKRAALLLLLIGVPGTVAIVAITRSGRNGDQEKEEARAAQSHRRGAKARPFLAPGEEESDTARSRSEGDRTVAAERSERGTAAAGEIPAELAGYGAAGGRPVKFGKLAWTPGMKWKVETHYRLMQHGMDDLWTERPILWNFEVKGTEKLDGRDVFVVDVNPADLAGMPFNPGGTMYVSMEDHTVVAVRDRVQERGLVRERFVRFEEGEEGAPSVLFPVEVPPPGSDGVERSSSTGAPSANPFSKDPKAEAPKSTGTVVDVEYEADGVTIRQRWDSTVPYWPLYSSTPSKVSYLRAEP
ncbi:MAG: hypothetical protein HYY17_09960 [Planctomycetes bacterium]|nr:hypothetical protein [Planctomycetota bacterium]